MSLLKYIRLAKKLSKHLGKRPKAVIDVENGSYVIITYINGSSRLKLNTPVAQQVIYNGPVFAKHFSKTSKNGNRIDISRTLEALEVIAKTNDHTFDSLYAALDYTDSLNELTEVLGFDQYVPVHAIGMIGYQEGPILDQVGLISPENQCHCLTIVNGWLSFTNTHFLVQTKAHSLVTESATIPGKACGIANEIQKADNADSFISEGKVGSRDAMELTAIANDYSVTFISFEEGHLLTPRKVASLEAEYEPDENITIFKGDVVDSILDRVADMNRPEVFDRLHKGISAAKVALGIKQTMYMQLNDNEDWDLSTGLYLQSEPNKKAKSKFTDAEIKEIKQELEDVYVHLGTYNDYEREGRYLHSNPIASIDLGYLNVVLSVGEVHNMLLNHHHRVRIDEDDHARMVVLKGPTTRAIIMGRLN